MLKNILCCILAAVVCTGCINIHAEKSSVAVKPEYKRAASLPAPMLRHVVLFRFKEGTSPEKIREVETSFKALADKIDVIDDFEWGTNVSVEDRSDGFTHCFILSFLNEADRDAYIVAPEHQALKQTSGPALDKVLVIDYWAK
jgi:hypothetical protein